MNLDKSTLDLPTEWELVKISDILTLGSGKDYKHLKHGIIPVYGTGGYMTSVNEYLYDGESVGIGRKGTIDKPVFLTGKFWTVDTLFYTHSFKNVIPYFIYLVFQSINWRKYSEATGVPSLSKNIIEPIKILLPPLPEQQKIAEILSTVDDKIEIIDQQITETQKLKKGLMQRLLTKGIGHTEFKDSPLGEIPENWEVNELRNVAKCTVGIATSTTHAYCKDGVLLLRNQNIKEGRIALKEVLYITPEFDLLNKSKRLKEGDIITVRTGYPGISAVVSQELSGSQSFTTLIIRLHNKNILSHFLCYYINSEKGKSFFQSSQAGGGQQNVGSKTLEGMKIIIPSIVEQKRITEILLTIDEKLEVLSEKKVNYQELKQGLMQQLLTGKIRVKV